MGPSPASAWKSIAFLSFCIASSQSAAVSCPSGYHLAGSRCYLIVTKQMSWVSAAEHCKSLGASLAAMETLAEYHLLKGLLLQEIPKLPAPEYQYGWGGAKMFWLGGYHDDMQKTYFWHSTGSSRTPIDLSWMPYHRSNGEDLDFCMIFQPNTWYFVSCVRETCGSVCECGPVSAPNIG